MKITLEHLTRKFPSRNRKERGEVTAVGDFHLEIPDGKLVGLLGPSGCGKSTALNLICGLLKPTQGRIFFGADDVTDLPPERRGVGLVFQNYALYPHLTVQQNIRFPLENLKGADRLSGEEMQTKVCAAARLVQIENLMERRPSELSGGQQQRVAIARALVKMPKVLLLDEPLSNLDARLRLQTREEIRRIQKETGITTIFVTHDQEEAMSISDLIVVMKEGCIQQTGRPQEVYDNPVNLFVAKFLGTPPINVFEGEVRNGRLCIGDDEVLDVSAAPEETVRADSAPDRTVCADNVPDRAVCAGSSPDKIVRDGDVPDRAVYVGIRPEGFLLREDGPFRCSLDRLEVMGRDVSAVSAHPCCLSGSIRSLLAAESSIPADSGTIRFALKPAKVFLFDKNTQERIPFSMQAASGATNL